MAINYWQSLDYDCHYHIYNRAVSNSNLFNDHADYLKFLNTYKEYCSPYLNTYAYCLIPNHFHLIVGVKSENEIRKIVLKESSISADKYSANKININDFLLNQFKRLFSSYALTHNKKYSRTGAIFQNKVKRVYIDNDDRLRYLIGYVHHNPIHHHISKDYTSWKYSSYQSLTSSKASAIAKDKVIELFEGTEQSLKFHEAFKVMKMEEP